MSKKSLDKVCVCAGYSNDKKAKECPYASKWIETDELPSFVGGECVCEGGCVAGLPNDFVGKKNQGLGK